MADVDDNTLRSVDVTASKAAKEEGESCTGSMAPAASLGKKVLLPLQRDHDSVVCPTRSWFDDDAALAVAIARHVRCGSSKPLRRQGTPTLQ